jgi:DNA-binding transcriptional LysR family regulator
MDETQLGYFLKIYETGSILRASAAAHLSQPSLSKRLRRLEDELKVPLFERTSAGVVPTIYGEALAKHARLVRAELESGQVEIDQLRRANVGHVRFGASPTIAADILPEVTTELWRTRPGFRFIVTEAAPAPLIAAVRSGALEFAVCTVSADGGDDTELVTEPVLQDLYVVIAASQHPLARRRRVTIHDLLKFPWVLAPSSGVVRKWFESKFILAGLAPPLPQVETPALMHLKRVVERSDFLSFMALRQFESELRRGTMTALCRPQFEFTRSVGAVYRAKGSLSPGARIMIDTVKIVAREIERRSVSQRAAPV